MAEQSSWPEGSYFHSLDCVDVHIDKPGDTTVRPIRPEDLERAKALRDRLLAAQAAGIDLSEQEVSIDKPGDTTIRPCRPSHLAHAKAERAKIMAALAAREQRETPPSLEDTRRS